MLLNLVSSIVIFTEQLSKSYYTAEPTLPALRRIRSSLRAAGRYGPSPFLVGHYGGVGEIAQGFCRVSAVAGGIYILGKRVTSVRTVSPNASVDAELPSGKPVTSSKYVVELEDMPEKLSCNVIISSADLLPTDLRPPALTKAEPSLPPVEHTACILRCIAIIDSPVYFTSPSPTPQDLEIEEDSSTAPPDDSLGSRIDTAIVVFPPGSIFDGSATASAHAMIMGEGSMATPSGKCESVLGTFIHIVDKH